MLNYDLVCILIHKYNITVTSLSLDSQLPINN